MACEVRLWLVRDAVAVAIPITVATATRKLALLECQLVFSCTSKPVRLLSTSGRLEGN